MIVFICLVGISPTYDLRFQEASTSTAQKNQLERLVQSSALSTQQKGYQPFRTRLTAPEITRRTAGSRQKGA